jgi:predicted methyltransferase
MSSRSFRALCAAASVAVTLFAVGPAAQQREHSETPREQWQRVPDILRELGAVPGAHIADLGAGSGFFTTRIAKAVGPGGRVYAIDVNPISLRELKEALGTDATNVDVIRGDENDPHLPEGRLDGLLVVNAYHEFAEYRAILEHVRKALKPNGRFVIVEPIPRRADDTSRQAQTKRHSIAMSFVEEDLKEAGFAIVTKDPGFVTRPEHQTDAERAAGTAKPTEWLLVARPRGDNQSF